MRISDWSSDVCSSDLRFARFVLSDGGEQGRGLFGDAAGALPAQSLAVAPETAVFQRIAAGGHADLLSLVRTPNPDTDRKSFVSGKSVSVRLDLGGRRIIYK